MGKVADIVIQKVLDDIDSIGYVPWNRPYEVYSSFNWYSMKMYRGINRFLLPTNEYISMKQVIDYNKKNGTNYRLKPGSNSHMVIFFKVDEKEVGKKEFESLDMGTSYIEFANSDNVFAGDYWLYFGNNGRVMKKRNILRYFSVFKISDFSDEDLGDFPSRYANGQAKFIFSKPKELFDRYIKNTGLKVEYTIGTPSYSIVKDRLNMNTSIKDEYEYWSTLFHEMAHSTAFSSRLNRSVAYSRDNEDYAKEEFIAEVVACLLCSECGIGVDDISHPRYRNSIAYLQSWKSKIKSWGTSFIYLIGEADKAFNYIMDMVDQGA